MVETTYDVAECARLNDMARCGNLPQSKIVITAGARHTLRQAIEAKTGRFPDNMSESVRNSIIEQKFLDKIHLLIFDTLNDPHKERDFTSFEIYEDKYFFKIEYYDPTMEYGSEDPTDLSKTMRVCTIFLPDEY